MTMISGRPAEVADRAVPGHWEGDLIIGTPATSAIATLVERASGIVMLAGLPDGHTAAQTRTALTAKIRALPQRVFESITWDQGKELAQHAQFTIDTGIKVYFCEPPARGSDPATRTPTDCCASTTPEAPTCPRSPTTSSTPSPTNSTHDLDAATDT